MSKRYKLFLGDCLEVMKQIPDKFVDCIICDLPYGTTHCPWDTIIPFEPLWKQYKRVRNNNCPIILFAQEPFASSLRMSNIEEYKYDWIWKKPVAPNFMMAKYVPLKKTELLCVFSNCGINTNCKIKMNYFPQGLIATEKKIKSNCPKKGVNVYNCLNKEYIQRYTNYPDNILEFNSENGLHPTQKPVALMEYLIKTYTKEGDIVLDNCMGSGTTGVACLNLNRKFIGIEKEEKYFNIAKERIEKAENERT